jgi:hypothetical protein
VGKYGRMDYDERETEDKEKVRISMHTGQLISIRAFKNLQVVNERGHDHFKSSITEKREDMCMNELVNKRIVEVLLEGRGSRKEGRKEPVDVSNKGGGEDAGADFDLPPELEVLGALGVEQSILIATHIIS